MSKQLFDHWYQLHVKKISDGWHGTFNQKCEGPFDQPALFSRMQELLDAQKGDYLQMVHYARATRVDVGTVGLYERKSRGWRLKRLLPTLQGPPVSISISGLKAAPKAQMQAQMQRGHLILKPCGTGGTDYSIVNFVPEDNYLSWKLIYDGLPTLTVAEATLTPVGEIGVDLTSIFKHVPGPDTREFSNFAEPQPSTHAGQDATPILGFRTWRLHVPSLIRDGELFDAEPRLYGPHNYLEDLDAYEWTDATKVAECTRFVHSSPALRCKCGVYALHKFAEPIDKRGAPHYSIQSPVRGVVVGRGNVLVHNDGWRAEIASIVGFDGDCVDDRFMPALRELARKFDVPVLPTSRLLELAMKKGRVMPKSELPEEEEQEIEEFDCD
jgi:hypothetical protein